MVGTEVKGKRPVRKNVQLPVDELLYAQMKRRARMAGLPFCSWLRKLAEHELRRKVSSV